MKGSLLRALTVVISVFIAALVWSAVQRNGEMNLQIDIEAQDAIDLDRFKVNEKRKNERMWARYRENLNDQQKYGTKPSCPHCREEVNINASVCSHCGKDLY